MLYVDMCHIEQFFRGLLSRRKLYTVTINISFHGITYFQL
jgi:hypothetical protein